MTSTRGSLAVLLAGACLTAAACRPLRVDSQPEIRGAIVAVHRGEALEIRHKTGQVYRVELTRETRLIHTKKSGDLTLCPGLRATVLLVGRAEFTASSVTIWSGRCK